MSFTKVAFVGIGIKIDTFVQKWKKKKPFINNGKISRKINLIFIKTNFASEGWNLLLLLLLLLLLYLLLQSFHWNYPKKSSSGFRFYFNLLPYSALTGFNVSEWVLQYVETMISTAQDASLTAPPNILMEWGCWCIHCSSDTMVSTIINP